MREYTVERRGHHLYPPEFSLAHSARGISSEFAELCLVCQGDDEDFAAIFR